MACSTADARASSHRLAFLSVAATILVGPAISSPLQIRFDNRHRCQNTEPRNAPRQDLDDLDFMAEAQPTLHLALELVEAIGDAIVLALDVSPHLVDQHSGDDPEDGRHDQEDLALTVSYTAWRYGRGNPDGKRLEAYRVQGVHQVLHLSAMCQRVDEGEEDGPRRTEDEEAHPRFLGEAPPLVLPLEVYEGIEA